MKKYKFFALAFAAMTLAGCSSDDVVDDGVKGGGVSGGQTGYVSLAINLPTEPSTRAGESFEQGTESEVKDATLLLFKGTSEATATFASAYDLDIASAGFGSASAGQVTTSGTIVQQITVPQTEDNENIYALVVLNDNGLINVAEGTTTVNGTNLSGTSTLSAFTNTVQDFSTTTNKGAAAHTGNGILMSNAPLSSAVGSSTSAAANVTTLATVDKTKIYPTSATAGLNPAVNVYVERAVAKVSVVDGKNENTSSQANGNITSYAINGWTLNITNNKTYLVRNVAQDGSSNWWNYASTLTTPPSQTYRFIGTNAVTDNAYRTYWGKDPNYDSNATGDFTSISGTVPTSWTNCGATNYQYCLENTFNVANMNENATTTAIIKATLTLDGITSGQDFYTVNGNTSTVYDANGIKAYIQNAVMNGWVDANWSTYASDGTLNGTDLTVTFTDDATHTGYVVASVKLDDAEGITWQSGYDLESFNTALASYMTTLNSSLDIACYKGGVAYYAVKIRHFDDSETPWSASAGQTSAYPGGDAEKNWLGRYGVLRNNWYEITVNSITNIGSPSVPSVSTDSDDSVDSYISATINVLSWAKRTQDVDL